MRLRHKRNEIKSGKRIQTPSRSRACSIGNPASSILLDCVLKFLQYIYPPTFYIRLHLRKRRSQKLWRKHMEEATHTAAHKICLAIDKDILDSIYKEAAYVPKMEAGNFGNLFNSGRIGMLHGHKLFHSGSVQPNSIHGSHCA